MDVSPSRIELHIEELMLDPALVGDWTPSDREALLEETAHALAFLFRAHGPPVGLEQGHSIDVIAPRQPASSDRIGSAEALAASIAQAIYGSLKR
ncbi:MAG: hypothetical protein NZ553_15500 [Caldilinea sp.]|nr:hypothetical protein [Caldilinea sp.]MDW8441880.1 hypothetical protein [Caldilineaceae bacterium]